ncbi:hypothetical protein DXV76_05895 [Rhodobacteraceae bacterium CCMM004]|nr:hypothetical protein DXV76_05895 [Rhodobacteraceae bacterium CCMM004]
MTDVLPRDEIDRLIDGVVRDPSRAEAAKLTLRATLMLRRPAAERAPAWAEDEDMWDNVPV